MPILTGVIASSISGHLWAPSGAYDAIASTTLSATAASITFSGIPSTYTHLQVRLQTSASAAANYYYQVNGDTGSNYSWHELLGENTSPLAGNAATQAQGYFTYSASSSYPTSAVLDFLDYGNIYKYKTIRALGGQDANSTGSRVEFTSTAWRNTAAITSITLYLSTGTFSTNGIFSLYGIR